jgi:Zn-dependent protease
MSSTSSQFRSQESTQQVIDEVHQRFLVTNEYLRDGGSIEFHLGPVQEDLKSKFISLVSTLRKSGDTAVLRRTDQGFFLVVARKPASETRKSKTPMILLIATLVTIASTGFIQAAYLYSDPLSPKLGVSSELWEAFLFTVAVFGIISIHEMGHKVASWYHKMDSSWPYFLPGVPGLWPTMGAVITARDPPINRDALFDLGISGPMAGLVVTVIVSIGTVFTVKLAPLASFPATQALGTSDFYTNFLIGIFRSPPAGQVIYGSTFSLLYFAYSFGFLITFVNLLPAWQLDGGHISNAAVSPRVHKALTYVSVVIMLAIGFYLMALLVLLFAGRAPALQPLDNISPLSRKRKAFFAMTWVLAILILVFVLYNGYFWPAALIK